MTYVDDRLIIPSLYNIILLYNIFITPYVNMPLFHTQSTRTHITHSSISGYTSCQIKQRVGYSHD